MIIMLISVQTLVDFPSSGRRARFSSKLHA
jgi:hypothetical protein